MSTILSNVCDYFASLSLTLLFSAVIIIACCSRHCIHGREKDKTGKDDIIDVRVVEHVASLDWGCLALLCDSYKETDSSIKLQIQPKISPYKAICKVKIDTTDTDSVKEDLNELMLYINNLLRTNGLSTVLTSKKESLESIYVPFVIAVDKTSLKNGIVKVTSQVTTLAESVHVTELVNHIALHCT